MFIPFFFKSVLYGNSSGKNNFQVTGRIKALSFNQSLISTRKLLLHLLCCIVVECWYVKSSLNSRSSAAFRASRSRFNFSIGLTIIPYSNKLLSLLVTRS